MSPHSLPSSPPAVQKQDDVMMETSDKPVATMPHVQGEGEGINVQGEARSNSPPSSSQSSASEKVNGTGVAAQDGAEERDEAAGKKEEKQSVNLEELFDAEESDEEFASSSMAVDAVGKGGVNEVENGDEDVSR